MAITSIRVLIVDDLERFRRVLSAALQSRRDVNVIGEASDGMEAVQLAEELQPDLILLDIGLPKLNGIEAARQIRRVSPNSKLIFVSQESSADIVQQAFNLGACGYVVKTDVGSELLAAVTAVLRGEQFVGTRFTGHHFTGTSDAEPSDAGVPEIFGNEAHPAPLLQNERRACRHEAEFYSDDNCFLDNLTQFVGAALKAENAVIVMASESHRKNLLQRLQAHDLNIGDAIEKGTYIALDAGSTIAAIMVNGMIDPVRFFKLLGDLMVTATQAANGEQSRVAIFGECVHLLWARGEIEAAIQFEKLGNQLTEIFDVDILCGYSLYAVQGGMDTHTSQRICAEHSAVHSR